MVEVLLANAHRAKKVQIDPLDGTPVVNFTIYLPKTLKYIDGTLSLTVYLAENQISRTIDPTIASPKA
jgi:hypothetical protein